MRLFKGNKSTPTALVLIDSGADFAMFDANAAGFLDLDYRKGKEATVQGVGTVKVWFHDDLGLYLKDRDGNKAAVGLRVAFASNFGLAGLVGRESFFEGFDITFRERDQEVVLDLREDAPNLIDPGQVPIYKPPLPSSKQSHRRPHPKR